MGKEPYVPWYKITEEVCRVWKDEHKVHFTQDIDVSYQGVNGIEEITGARAYALGYVAERMYALNQLKGAQVVPSLELGAFRAWTTENVDSDDSQGVGVESAVDKKLVDHFERTDEVTWKIMLITGKDLSDDLVVYNSGDDAETAVDRSLKETMFLSDYFKI